MKKIYFLIDRLIHFTIGMVITLPVAIFFHWLGYSSDARSFMAGSVFMLYLTNTWTHRFINKPKDSKSDDHDMHNYVVLEAYNKWFSNLSQEELAWYDGKYIETFLASYNT